jgi:hypothetical protein
MQQLLLLVQQNSSKLSWQTVGVLFATVRL